MNQKNIVLFLKKYNPRTIYVVIQIIHKKLLKLFLQNLLICTDVEYFFLNKN